jgi:hypothetical protein
MTLMEVLRIVARSPTVTTYNQSVSDRCKMSMWIVQVRDLLFTVTGQRPATVLACLEMTSF